MSTAISYSKLNDALRQHEIALTSAELHGFLTGLICGDATLQHWQPLLYQFTNDDHAYPSALLEQVQRLYSQIKQQLADMEDFSFELFLPESDDIFARADALSEWVNHFLLGLGLTQKHLDKETGDIGEALDDLQDIAKLSYEPDDNPQELAAALEEISEYVRTIVMLFYSHFNLSTQAPVNHSIN